MRRRVVGFAPEAQADLVALADWIADKAGETAAERYLDRIIAACLSLAITAERGTQRNDLRQGLRTMGFERRATIIFTVESAEVLILRVFYGGQNWETAFQ
ncbi:MAG: type II toxin-antitoxin system RelE/ParE family toxin [Alphaproteobacteria bacterium]|nr:type II toxin-antitoxin system RelE/ParE family toxin [Alphaproteobacteria bacterium]